MKNGTVGRKHAKTAPFLIYYDEDCTTFGDNIIRRKKSGLLHIMFSYSRSQK